MASFLRVVGLATGIFWLGSLASPAAERQSSGPAIGFLIFSPREFSPDDQAVMLTVCSYTPFLAITRATTTDGRFFAVKSAQRPQFIPLPTGDGVADYNSVVALIDSCRSRYPQFAKNLDAAAAAWKMETTEAALRKAQAGTQAMREKAMAQELTSQDGKSQVTFTQTDGKVVRTSHILGAGKEGLRVMTAVSIMTIPIELLPRDILEKYGYISVANSQPTPRSTPPQLASLVWPKERPADATPVVKVHPSPEKSAPASTAPPKIAVEAHPFRPVTKKEAVKVAASKPVPPPEITPKVALQTLRASFSAPSKTRKGDASLSASGLFEFLGNAQDYRKMGKVSLSSDTTTTIWEKRHPSNLRVLYTESGERLLDMELLIDRTYFETYMPELVPSLIAPIAKQLMNAEDAAAFLVWLKDFPIDLPFESNQGVTLGCGMAELLEKKPDARFGEYLDVSREYVSIKVKTSLSRLAPTRDKMKIAREGIVMGDGHIRYQLALSYQEAASGKPGRWVCTLSSSEGEKKDLRETVLLSGFDLSQYQQTIESLDEVAEWSAAAAGKNLRDGTRANPLFTLFLRADKSFAVWHKNLTGGGKIAAAEGVLRPKQIFALRWLLARVDDAVDAHLENSPEAFRSVSQVTPRAPGG